MRFKLFAISKDSSASFQEYFESETEEETKDCFNRFETSANDALRGERWYIDYDSVDTEDATEEQLALLEELSGC